MKPHSWLLSGALGMILAGCEVFGLATQPPAGLCAEAARDYSGTVVGAFSTTVGSIESLEPRQSEPMRWSNLPLDHPAVLCYIDGEIAKAPPIGASGDVTKPYDRAAVAIVDGKAELIVASYRDQLPVHAP
jgi:hypothetical protein